MLDISQLQCKKDKYRKTKEPGAYKIYSEDTIRSYNDSGLPERLGFSRKQTEDILRTVGFLIMKRVVLSNRGFVLPFSLGSLRIVGVKSKARDRKKTNEYQKNIYHRNVNTEGYAFRIKHKFDSKWRFQNLKSFRSSTGLKKAVHETVKREYMKFSLYDTFRESCK
jgi:hypothetical protein